MSASVAEYLGIAVHARGAPVAPVALDKSRKNVPCPFRAHHCSKVESGNQPVCSVRDTDGVLWLVCPHRLCSTNPKKMPLSPYQRGVLLEIG